MAEIKSFKELNVVNAPTKGNGYVGEKISVARILGTPIIVHFYKIVDSDYPDKGNGKCLWLQIEMGGLKWLVRTGSVVLQDTIKTITHFPFSTILMEKEKSFIFT